MRKARRKREGLRPRLLGALDDVRTSLWAVPTGLALAALVLARALTALDQSLQSDRWAGWVLLYAGSIESARTTLSTLAGSMITVAGLVFSMTVVTLSFASANLGPRLLRNFRSDRVNQVVLGSFVATFLYDLSVLSSLRQDADGFFVPRIAISAGLLLSTLAFGVLLYFVHHLAREIQADHAIDQVRRKLDGHVERLAARGLEPGDADAFSWTAAAELRAEQSGYLQLLDHERMADEAQRAELRVRCGSRAGDFVLRGAPLLELDRAVAEETLRALRDCFVVGAQRTDAQDLEYSIRQLVEIALRALSPGIHDPYTAIACIDHLGAGMALLGEGPAPAWCFVSEGRRVLYRSVDFEGAMDTAWNQIRQTAADQPAVAMRLLEVLGGLAGGVGHERHLAAVEAHARKVLESSRSGEAIDVDRQEVEERFRAALEGIEARRAELRA